MLASLAYVASHVMSSTPAPGLTATKAGVPGAKLAAVVVAYFALQASVAAVGDPTKHLSTSVHQSFGRPAVMKRDAFGNSFEENVSGDGPTHASANDYVVEGVSRARLTADLERKRDALEDVSKFLAAAEKRVALTQQALAEAKAWASQPERIMPSLRKDEYVRDLEATNTVRVARIKAHLETRLDRELQERAAAMQFEHRLRGKIAQLEQRLEQGSVDPAGNPVVPPHEFGPGSVWYTIRGVASAARSEETAAVCFAAALGASVFTKAMSLV